MFVFNKPSPISIRIEVALTHKEIRDTIKADCPTLKMGSGFDTQLTGWINRGQNDIAKRTGCVQVILPLKTDTGVRRYDIPSQVRKVTEVYYGPNLLQKINYDSIDFSSTSTNIPTKYAIKGRQIYLVEAPDSASILKLTGTKETVDPLKNNDDKSLVTIKYAETLIFFVKYMAHLYRRKYDEATLYKAEYEKSVKEIMGDDLDADGILIADWPAVGAWL